jgi:peptidoglycan/LPS O-acetylase OafA/YrhL
LTAHFWSLCVEVHFYVAAAILVALLDLRGLLLLPVFALAITSLRAVFGVPHQYQDTPPCG